MQVGLEVGGFLLNTTEINFLNQVYIYNEVLFKSLCQHNCRALVTTCIEPEAVQLIRKQAQLFLNC